MEESDYTQGLPLISPKNMLPVKVIRREIATEDTVTIYVVLPGTTQSPAPYLPGQFVTLALPTPRETLYRSYSLCGDGDPERPWEIAVKRQHMGAVSTYFYNSVEEGTLLYASLPRGTFTLPGSIYPDDRFVFVAAGSGITPIYGMLRYLSRLPDSERPLVQLHYASRTVDDIIYRDELERLDPYQQWIQSFYYLSSEGNRMTVDKIIDRAGRVAQRANFYYCGPETLKRQLIDALEAEGVPAQQIHAEVFATQQAALGRPAYRLTGPPSVSHGGNITVAQTGQSIPVEPQETILAALERNGYKPDFSCRAGACGACKLKLIAGLVDPVGEALSNADRAEGYILSCIAHPMGPITLATGGRPPAGVATVNPAVAAEAGSAGSARSVQNVALVRVGALAALGVVLLGAWNLTNHKPLSWSYAQAAAPPSNAPTDVPGQPTDTAAPNQPTAPPTATLKPGQPTYTPAPPTPTLKPGQPTPTTAPPTATPIPVPTATLKPGQPTPTPAPPTATPKPAPTATPKPAPTATATTTK